MGRGRPRSIHFSPGELRELYFDKGLTLKEIGAVVGVSKQAVSQRMKELGIDTSTPRPTGHVKNKGGGRTPSSCNGYPSFYLRKKTVYCHRLVAAQILGRPLTGKEAVHHCNEVRSDNRPENLWVFPDNASHRRYHGSGVIHPDTIFLKDFLKEDEHESEI